jgi:hypothetical protein
MIRQAAERDGIGLILTFFREDILRRVNRGISN